MQHISPSTQVYIHSRHYTKDEDAMTIQKYTIHDTAIDTYTYRGTVGKCWGDATLEGNMMGGEV